MEEWRDIRGYEGFYQVSNFGRVRSIDRVVKCRDFEMTRKGVVLKDAPMTGGYRCVALQKDGKRKTFYVHRLVADAFVPNPNKLNECDHINRNPSDNRSVNLRWCTHEENVANKKVTASGERYIYRHKTKWRFCKAGLPTKVFATFEEALQHKLMIGLK